MSVYGSVKRSELKTAPLPAVAERADFWGSGAPRAFGTQSGLPIAFDGAVPAPIVDAPARQRQLFVKRAMDIVLAIAAVIALLPLLILVAIAIKATSAGPVLFRQAREGYKGRLFQTYKFRTMWSDSGDLSGVSQTVSGDSRVTPIGRFLRRSSIDELPQLFNVLLGDMSLVGPRPHVPGMLAARRNYKDLVPYYDARLAMKPGITGWAQANGLRGPTDDASKAKARIDHDVAYVQNFSVWLDLKIIAMTIRSEFLSGSGV